MMGQHEAMDAATVAELLGVTDKSVRNWINLKGLPSHGEGRQRTFVWAEVLDWYWRYKASLDKYSGNDGNGSAETEEGVSGNVPDAKLSERRRASYVADIKKIERDKLQGRLVPMEEVSNVLNDVMKGLQTEIRGFPNRVTGPVLAIRDQPKLFDYLTVECDLLLTRLAQLRFEPSEPKESDE